MNEIDVVLGELPRWYFYSFAAIFGALWGSFANVVIVRWPLGQSVVRPASHCFSCEKTIPFYDNIPIISYLILRGRCRFCRARFSPRYMIVELCTALLSVGVMQMTVLSDPPTILYGLTAYVIYFSFVWALVTAGMIDLATFLLPDEITLSGILIGILVQLFVFDAGWFEPIVGAVGSYVLLFVVFVYGYQKLSGQQGMGEGDPKLLAMIGAFLGPKGALFALFAGAFQGLIIGSGLVIYRRKTGEGPPPPLDDEILDDEGDPINVDPRFRKAQVPFGPFLAIGALEYLFFGETLLNYYLSGMASIFGLN